MNGLMGDRSSLSIFVNPDFQAFLKLHSPVSAQSTNNTEHGMLLFFVIRKSMAVIVTLRMSQHLVR